MDEERQPRLWIGTSGWVYPHWREVFYPTKLPTAKWLSHYTQHFPTVELNNSFYRLPSERAFRGWREKTPQGFLFAVKANRYITHMKKLRDAGEPLEKFLNRAGRGFWETSWVLSSTNCPPIGIAIWKGCGSSWLSCPTTWITSSSFATVPG
jgi:hypothetical protein